MNKTSIVAIVFFFVAIHTGTVTWGQKQDDSLATVYGKLFDTDGQAWASMFKGAPNVMLTDSGSEETDTLYTAAAFDGSFIFRNLIPRKIRLKVTCVGMKTIENEYVLEPGRNVIYLTLYPQTEKIKESGVSAEVPLMKRIADTTIFNAAAVRTLDGESVRSILEQLPALLDAGEQRHAAVTVDAVADAEPVEVGFRHRQCRNGRRVRRSVRRGAGLW